MIKNNPKIQSNFSFPQENVRPKSTIDVAIKKINDSLRKRKFEELENPNKDENKEPLLKKRKITKENTTTDTKNEKPTITKPTIVLLPLFKKIIPTKKH